MVQEPQSNAQQSDVNRTADGIPAEAGGPFVALLRQYLDAALAGLYDFAARLTRDPAAAAQAVEAALLATLDSPEQITSADRFRVLVFSQIYRIAAAVGTAEHPTPLGEMSRLQVGAPRWLTVEAGALIWEAASRLPLEQYAALHLHIRAALGREAIAEALDISPAYAFVLLGRAERRFVEAVSTGLLIKEASSGCPVLDDLRTRDVEDVLAFEVQRQVQGHLAAGCDICRGRLAGYGDVGSLLGVLAPLPVPADLPARLHALLTERAPALQAVPAVTPSATVAAAPAAVEAGHSGGEPGLRTSRWSRFWQWVDERDIPARAVVAGTVLVLILGLLAFVILSSPRQEGTDQARVLAPAEPAPAGAEAGAGPATPQPAATPAEGSIFQVGRPSTPATGRIPEVPTTAAGEPAGTPPAAQTEVQLTPRLTATPQNRTTAPAAGTVIILNPGTVRQPAAAPPAPAVQPRTVEEPAVQTATAEPTPPPPRLTASTPSLTFARGEIVKVVTLSNAGTGQVTWQVAPQQAWILAAPSGGTLTDSATLQVRVDRDLLGQRGGVGSLVVSSNAGNVVISVTVE